MISRIVFPCMFMSAMAIMLSLSATAGIDSLGIERRQGEWMILHQVEAGETVYAIARRYGIEASDIQSVNPGSTAGIGVGQILQVPYSKREFLIHQVKRGETLYSISQRYGMTTRDVRDWNDLTTLEIQTGDFLKILDSKVADLPEEPVMAESTVETAPVEELAESPSVVSEPGFHVILAGETLYSISRAYGITPEELREWNELEGNDLAVGDALRVEPPPGVVDEQEPMITPDPVAEDPVYAPTAVPFVKDSTTIALYPDVKVPVKEEQGLAEVIEGFDNQEKYLALHRTAPSGSLLMVRNEMNDQMVFVRVVGPLPDTGLNDKVIVKISRPAWERIHGVNPKLRVKVYQLEGEHQ